MASKEKKPKEIITEKWCEMTDKDIKHLNTSPNDKWIKAIIQYLDEQHSPDSTEGKEHYLNPLPREMYGGLDDVPMAHPEQEECEHGVVKKYCYNCKNDTFMGKKIEMFNKHHYLRLKDVNSILSTEREKILKYILNHKAIDGDKIMITATELKEYARSLGISLE